MTHLDEFSLSFVVENVSDVLGEDVFPGWTGVDAGVGDADGPGSVADGHLHVPLVAGDVVALEGLLDHLDQAVTDVVRQRLLLQHSEQRLQVDSALGISRRFHLACWEGASIEENNSLVEIIF